VDLTDEHLARKELYDRETELQQFQKMEAVGRLAAGVSHEFRNLLTVMQGHTDILQSRVAASDSLRGEIDPIARAIDRASDLTAQLSAFGRQQPLELTLLNLNTVISDYMPILRRTLGESIEVRVELDPDLGLARADSHQLGQLLLNVVLNSRDAMPGGGRLVITTSPAELDESFPALGAPLTLGSYVQLSIADTGAGMSEDVRARVFEPFFTTKKPGKGSGLGLSTAHGIVRQLGGYIWLSSEPGRGTTFKMYLPRVFAGDSGLPTPPPGGDPPRQAPLTVLLIEDDAGVRNVERRLLEAAGHRVLEAHDADSAIAQVRGRTEALDLVMCDIMLPGRNGHEVVAAIRTLRPGIRALFVSGHSRDVLSSTGAAPGLTFLQKPFSAGDLKDAVRRALADVPPLPPR
jgi:nitrogen-specific signal transduction histidine kinase/CheY-like chemotaxis protein